MCKLPPPQHPSYWAARTGRLHATLDAALEFLRRGEAKAAENLLREAQIQEQRAEDDVTAMLLHLLRRGPQ